MPRARLTDRLLKSLARKGTGGPPQLDHYDTSLPICWGVRVTRDGSVTWFYRYTTAGGHRRRLKLGRYPVVSLATASLRAVEAAQKVERGEDPAADAKRKGGRTVNDLADLYVERYARQRRRRWRHLRYLLDRFVLPEIGQIPAEAVTRAEIRRLLEAPLERGSGYMANEILAAARGMWRWAVSEDLVQSDPTAGIRPPMAVKPRQRVLTPEEIRALWRAWDLDGNPAARALQVALLVPVRRGSLLPARFSEVRGEEWTIPGERFKAGVDFLAFLPPEAMDVLERVDRLPRGELFFPSPLLMGRPIGSWLQAATRAAKRAGVKDFRPHDLRSTWATHARRHGVSREVVRASLGHAPLGVTQRHYDFYEYHAEKREAFRRMAKVFMGMVRDPGLAAVR